MPAEYLSGQKVLILGGAGRMGKAIALQAAAQGADIILVGRTQQTLDVVAAQLPKTPRCIVGDVTDDKEMKRIFTETGVVDHVVVAVSSTDAQASGITNTAPANARVAYGRVWATYNVLHFAPKFVSKHGSIVLISGSSGRRALLGFGVWTGVHGAIEALGRAAAVELAPIRVNVLSPGSIGMPPYKQLAKHAGQPEDVARAVMLLLSSPAITSAVLDVDGGEQLGTWMG